MIKNFWADAQFYCLNHDEPIKMIRQEGDTPFYACPRYMRKDADHPDGHEDTEPMCLNRISFTSLTNLMEKFMKIVEEDDEAGIISDYRGMRFSIPGIEAKVLSYRDGRIKLGILNKRAIHA